MNDILNMQAGRELDVRIHHMVMGEDLHLFAWPKNGMGESMVKVTGDIFHWKDIPYYSSDIAAAWEVIEKFHEVTVKRFETMKGHRYYCRIELTYDGEPIIAQGATAPEAISKAALLALEGNRGG